MNSDQCVITEVTLSTNQIKYLIDVMWSCEPKLSQQISIRHQVSDVELERHLQICLGSALSELI
jgi:hypothetical protein